MTTASPAHTDREALRTKAYRDERPLETRRAIYDHRRPRLDLVGEVVHRLRDVPGGVLADVGCGSGAYSKALRAARPDLTVIAADLSAGMVSVAGAPGVVTDATHLPLATRSCSAVLALHMLYHVPDPRAAVAEFARVVREDGSVLIMGNREGDKHELDELWDRAAMDVLGHPAGGMVGGHLSAEEMGELAREAFPVVESVSYRARTVVPEAAPVIAFFDSTRALSGLGGNFDAVLARASALIQERVATEGAFAFTNHTGMYRAQVA
ncbi:hypothetical protein Afil01_38070 [Actinorhabdospora filicis]|uniref:Methyltransferase type 11 domain-containing protein n=1 Tax=Actinorhabdospora filicis TaxID=1785913 RepID=A0A9W6SL60_9ACTN|nr:class I SAM-dependent methyltransferase [Actinorhabdospora filicis]GLZ79000.1 hypothetical protein Afil01_38070 [Actinorhabdospora filicis]